MSVGLPIKRPILLKIKDAASGLALIEGGGSSSLRREANGTATVISLATPWRPLLTRQPDGTVTVSG